MVKRQKDFGDYSRAHKYRLLARQRRNLPSSEDEENEVNGRPGVQWDPVPQNLQQNDAVNLDRPDEPVRSPTPPAADRDCNMEPEREDEVDQPQGDDISEHHDSEPSDPSESEDSSNDSSSNASDSDDSDDNDSYDSNEDNNDDDDDDDDDDDGDDGGGGDGDGDGDGDDDDGDYDDPNNAPLYDGAPITVTESMLSILSLGLAHNLSGSCLADILELVAMHCPENNFCSTSFYKFKKFFANLKSPLTRRYICSVCFESIDNPNANCPRCQVARTFDSYLQIPVLPQVRGLFKRPGFYEKILNNQNREKQVEANYEDIYDGSIYQNLKTPGNLLADENSFSLTWYTDGVRIFRSSKNEIWPFCLTINELPYRERTKIDNVIIAGLWFGKKKPLVNHYLKFIQHDLRTLRDGVDVVVPNRIERIRVRGVVMCGTCDLPAKAIFLNMKQYNAINGCQVCKIETVRERQDAMKRIYPFEYNINLRTDEEHQMLALQAQALNRVRLGVKGRSAISTFVASPIQSTAVDIMHDAFMGVGKLIGSIWFLKENANHPASLLQYVRDIDRRLLALRPPDFLQRQPRSISTHFRYWNASELKSWLMVYSLPVVDGIMAEHVFTHHKFFVFGISLLCGNSVSPEMVQLASRLLREYVNRFQLVYGVTHMTANVHLLRHLPLMVERFGPLWTTSCFPYESCNGVLKKFVTGTRFAEFQIHSAASMFLHLTAFRAQHLAPGGRPAQFCDRLNNFRKKYNVSVVSERMAVVGKMQRVVDLPHFILNELDDVPLEDRNYFVFKRLFDRHLKIVFSSLAHNRASKTNSTCVKYYLNDAESFGIVHSYLKITHCNCQAPCECDGTFVAIIKECIVEPAYRLMPYGILPLIHTCTYVDNYISVPIENLVYVCYLVDVRETNTTVIVEPMNTHEIE